MPEVEVEEITGPKGFVIIFPAREDAPAKKERATIAELKNFSGTWRIKDLERVGDGTSPSARGQGD